MGGWFGICGWNWGLGGLGGLCCYGSGLDLGLGIEFVWIIGNYID